MSKLILSLFLWIIFTSQISAECMHSGDLYLNGSSWHPDTCSSCTCQDPVAVCKRKRCTVSACDPHQGKRLVMLTGSCCPVCKDMRYSCQQDGHFFENNAVWSVTPCTTCHCKWGHIDCSSRKCPTVRCLPEETLNQFPEECCPKCVQTRNSCFFDSKYHPEGSTWNPIPCTKCFCQNGRVKCFPVQCPSLVCPTGHIELLDGECCPQCSAFTCKQGGQTFQEGDNWQKTPCEVCSCIAAEWICIQNQCNNNLSCPSGQVPWTLPGECCPECVEPSGKGQCDKISPTRSNGEIWQNKGCEFCQCNRGRVQCQHALCPQISCQEPFVKVYKEGQCCSECILPLDCEFNERKYKSGSVWHPDNCSVCNCNNGDVSCYQQTCTVCPPNTYHVPTESSCCGYCQPYKCPPECVECVPTQPSVCTKCTNPKQFVDNGECLNKCPVGHYGSPENVCKKCHESCIDCSKGGPYYCSVCKSGLLYLEGQCVSQCPEGYHLQNWGCQACHQSCRTCTGPEMGNCLTCSLPGQLLFKGRCIDRCPSATYVENKHCIACPQGCHKCSATSKKCLVCADDAILHNGHCLLSCPEGFYSASDGIHCIACHPACLKCDGEGKNNCLSCHRGAKLIQGTCHMPCSPGEYRTYNGYCKACYDGCELCHIDASGKESNCISCINKREKPSGNKCVSSCGASQYLQNGFCRDCATGCLRCTNDWTCQECQLPLVLSDGKCVTHCDAAEYVHIGKGGVCNGCSPGCAKCSDKFNCFACFDGMFLKNNAECVEDCGPDYYSNSEERLCEENSFAPEIRVVDQLLINGTDEFGSLHNIVEVLDADTLEKDLIIYLVKPPENGNIVKINHRKNVILSAKDTFSLREMQSNRVIYMPGEDKMTKDFFVLKASDRQLFSANVIVEAVSLPEGEIKLVRNKPLTVVAGQIIFFNRNNIDITSEVPPENVTLTILTGPFHGKLATSPENAHVFTLNRWQQGEVFYRHDGSNTTKDSFVLQAYDGYNILNIIVDINIRSKDSKKPILINKKMGYVKKGEIMQITSKILEAVSGHQEDAKNGDIVYTLIPSHNNPENGDIIMVVPALRDEHKDEGWQMMEKNQMSIHLVRFLQRDIDEGRIWYKHNGGENTLDRIYFEVADTCIPPHVLSHQEFQISVSGSTELVSKLSEESQISVLENKWLPLDKKLFTSSDTASLAPSNLLYLIISPLPSGDGFLQHIDRPFQPVTNFTQEDVNNHRIRYKSPIVGSNEKEISFKYAVVDQSRKEKNRIEKKFIVRVLPVRTKGLQVRNTHPFLVSTQGGWVYLVSELFSFSDSNSPISDFVVKLLKPPQHGKIQFQKGGKMLEMMAGEKLLYSDLRGNLFRYLHDGKSRSREDYFEFSVEDQFSEIKIFVSVKILPVEKTMPYPLPQSSQILIIEEGEDVKITKDIFSFRHRGSFPKDIRIVLLSSNVHGKLLLKKQELAKGDDFTQRDVNRGFIRYKANREIGAHMTTEIMIFNISDSSKIDVLPYQSLALMILPVDNQPPELNILTPIRVTRGLQRMLSTDNIKATDVDTEISVLDVVIHHQPNYGLIKMASKDLRTLEMITDFPYEALADGRVIYEQSLHIDPETTEDDFTVYVTDGINRSPVQNIAVFFSDSPEEYPVLVSEQIFVKEDHSVTLTNSSLSVIGVGHKVSEVIFKIDQLPMHGFLKKKRVYTDLPFEAQTLKKNDSFTYKDILGSLILYKHEGDEETTDSFTLSVSNDVFFERVVMSVVIGLLHEETPRVVINGVLRMKKGSTETITSSILKSTDVDTDDAKLIYRVLQAPDSGSLQLNLNGAIQRLTTHNTFTQTDINKGLLEYSDYGTGNAGNVKFKFTVADPQGNELLNQYFYIIILDDRSPPIVDRNEELILLEGRSAFITGKFLSASDDKVNNNLLNYTVIEKPRFGHLEFTSEPGVPIFTFTQSDLIDNKVKYDHTSPEKVNSDSFLFSISDGQNKVVQKFSIIINPVDDSIPVVINKGLRVQQGTRKLITEFDLKVVDNDTKVGQIVFHVVDPTWHGLLQFKQRRTYHHSVATSFTMEDIYENRLSYLHDGSGSFVDHFKFTVNDGTNFVYSTLDETREISSPSAEPSKFEIQILPLGDGSPVLETNLGLQFLETSDYGAFNVISEKELKSTDPDTDNKNLLYVITTPPKEGRLQNNDNPKSFVSSFTQENINQGKILYVLTGNSSVGEDHFVFDLRNRRSNTVPYNIFHISWSVVSFEQPVFNISETAHLVRIPLVRSGNLKQHSIVTCVTRPGSATSMQSASHQGTYDFVQHSSQIHFYEWQDEKECVVTIKDDSIFEGEETFYVELRTSAYTLIGQTSEVAVTVYDHEDEPVIEFTEETFHVNETDGYLRASLRRKGDFSQAVSVICSTNSMTAVGSTGIELQPGADFIGREETNSYRVVFPQDVRQTTCLVKIIDDTIYEAAEYFQLILSDPSSGARLGLVNKAVAVIDGPNDESLIFFSKPLYIFNESAGVVEIDVFRSGSDQTHTSIVWCATRLSSPLSALPQQDYVPVSNQITFRPGQTSKKCQLTIIDDNINPKLEGNETFEVFLSSSVGSNLNYPFSAVVLITDITEDVAILQFENNKYEVDEMNSSISVPIIRSGDIGFESSVVCYTEEGTAETGTDFKERTRHPSSTITFKSGETTKNCTVFIKDDAKFEKNESFTLFLISAFGEKNFPAVLIGEKNNATIVITNSDDVPRVQFKEAAYSVTEPKAVNEINTLIIQVIRTGDISQTSSVRCTPHDASAVSGLDYNAKSVILLFEPGIQSVDYAVDILYNSHIEWHESFVIVLEPEDIFGAEIGKIQSTTVTILDNKVSGSIVFPAPPIVVSLLYYDDVEKGLHINPSPGYPLVCVTPCDHHYPAYLSTQSLCEEAGINSTQVSFKWEAAFPSQVDENSYQPFVEITDNTLFTEVTGVLLDSVYFRPRYRLRCSAAPTDKGNSGIRLKSNIVDISQNDGICHSPIYTGNSFSYQAQSFVASLMYTPISDPKHPNTIQISVTIPHQDGMLPLVSTMPLNNIKFLLSEAIYRQHHVCSNLMEPSFTKLEDDTGFWGFDSGRIDQNSGSVFPYQFDEKLRTKKTLQLYRHLDLKHCTWTFRAWYHMTDLVDQCGGKILTNFKVTDSGQSFLTVRVPLYVSYLYASPPVGWSSLEHHTEMQFSFYYQSVLWNTGLEVDGQLGGHLQVLRIAIGEGGHLVIDFRTQANFRGLYVLEHHTEPLMKSRLLPPKELPISFDLALLWSGETYDSPKQLWRATSQESLKDYTGLYIIELLPCTVKSTQKYALSQKPIKCTAHKLQRFKLPISFQQTNRPVPVEYSLNTLFQLTNEEKVFSSNPRSMENSGSSIEELDYNGAFSKGQKIYARVLWNPDQDLSTAYKLSIKKVYLCTGKEGYIPTYDPTGETYKDGSQFGCVRPNLNLKHRFLLLDRDHDEKIKIDVPNMEFEAKFVDETSQYSSLKQRPGIDGFEMPVDPLYKLNSGHQWYLQVLYVIGPANSPSRVQRSAILTGGGNSLLEDGPLAKRNGTNMRMLLLDEESLISRTADIVSTVVPGVALFLLILAIIAFVVVCRHLKRTQKPQQAPVQSSMVFTSGGLTQVSKMSSVKRGQHLPGTQV